MSAAEELSTPPGTALDTQWGLWRSSLSAHAKGVGALLAAMAFLPSRGGVCEAAISTLARLTGLGETTTREAIRELQFAGVVEVTLQFNSPRRARRREHNAPNLYRVIPGALKTQAAGAGGPPVTMAPPLPRQAGGGTSPGEPGVPRQADQGASPGEPKEIPSEIEEKKEGGEGACATPQGSPEPTAEADRNPATQGLMDWFQKTFRGAWAARHGAPAVDRSWGDQRHAAIIVRAARAQAEAQQARCSARGEAPDDLDDLARSCLRAQIDAYLATPGRPTTDHPGGFLLGRRHPLRFMADDLELLAPPWAEAEKRLQQEALQAQRQAALEASRARTLEADRARQQRVVRLHAPSPVLALASARPAAAPVHPGPAPIATEAPALAAAPTEAPALAAVPIAAPAPRALPSLTAARPVSEEATSLPASEEATSLPASEDAPSLPVSGDAPGELPSFTAATSTNGVDQRLAAAFTDGDQRVAAAVLVGLPSLPAVAFTRQDALTPEQRKRAAYEARARASLSPREQADVARLEAIPLHQRTHAEKRWLAHLLSRGMIAIEEQDARKAAES